MADRWQDQDRNGRGYGRRAYGADRYGQDDRDDDRGRA